LQPWSLLRKALIWAAKRRQQPEHYATLRLKFFENIGKKPLTKKMKLIYKELGDKL
jgi:hypothetical protein